MPLFRTPLLTQDPRYRYIVTLCNYFFATLFLGMLVILSGVMLLTYVDGKHNQDNNHKENVSFARILGIILLVFGCIFLISSLIVFILASIMYVRTRTTPPENIDQAAEPNLPTDGLIPQNIQQSGGSITVSDAPA